MPLRPLPRTRTPRRAAPGAPGGLRRQQSPLVAHGEGASPTFRSTVSIAFKSGAIRGTPRVGVARQSGATRGAGAGPPAPASLRLPPGIILTGIARICSCFRRGAAGEDDAAAPAGRRGRRGEAAEDPPAQAEAPAGRGRKRGRDADPGVKLEPEEVSDEKAAKREAVQDQLETALETAQQLGGSLAEADGTEAPAAADDEDDAAPMATEDDDGSRSSRTPRGAGVKQATLEPRVTKAQAAAMAEAEAADKVKQAEMTLAASYMSETSSNAAEEKILKQAKHVKKRSDSDSLVRRMTRYSEPPRKKSHWDYLLQEMEWMSNDFRQERKWKMALAKKTAQAVMKWHKQKEGQQARNQKIEQQNLKKIAGRLSRDVRTFWGQVGKLVVYKHEMQIEEVRQQNMEKHMDFMVGQTEQYSQLLSAEIQKPGRRTTAKDDPKADPDFQPGDAADDEATLAEEEGAGQNPAEKEAVDAMEKEKGASIKQVLESHGVDKDAAAAGEIPAGEGATSMDVAEEEVSAADAAARDDRMPILRCCWKPTLWT